MKSVISIAALSLVAACGAATGTISTSTSPSPVAVSLAAVDATSGQSFANMLNNVRSVNSAGAVVYDARLGVAAQRHANDMLANPGIEHVGSDGSTIGTRANDAGYNYRNLAENIARGYSDEEAVLRGWINSPLHQANNINPIYEDFALAKAGSGSSQTWVLMLGRE